MDLPQILIPWRWPHFTPDELRCKASGACLMDAAFLDRLELIRQSYGQPLVITSGYRSPAHNAEVSHTGENGPHTTGRAVDIQIRGAAALALIRIALFHGMTGIGVSQKGDSRFIHLDDLPDAPGQPRCTIWSY